MFNEGLRFTSGDELLRSGDQTDGKGLYPKKGKQLQVDVQLEVFLALVQE